MNRPKWVELLMFVGVPAVGFLLALAVALLYTVFSAPAVG